MITTKHLKDLLNTFQETPADFGDVEDPKILKAMQDESAWVFAFFNQFTLGEEDTPLSPEAIASIRNFFRLRWEHLKTTSLACTRNPLLPASQVCRQVAEMIAAPQEPVCTILMPGLIGLNRANAGLLFETQNGRRFELEKFIISQDYRHLIPVEEIFETAAEDTCHVLRDFQPEDAQIPFEISTTDWINLEQVAGAVGAAFIDLVKQHHTQRHDNRSLGFALKKLATELHKSSVKDAGSEEQANNALALHAIESFYALWRTLPADLCLPAPESGAASSTDASTPVKNLCLQGYGNANITLEDYLLTLFLRLKDYESTDARLEQLTEKKILHCAHQLSNYLFEFLLQYPALYHLFPETPASTLPPLKERLPAALIAFAQRPPMCDGDDSNLPRKFLQVLQQSADRHTAAAFLAPRMCSYDDLLRLRVYPLLFDAVAEQLGTRIAELPFIPEMHTLLYRFSPEQQQLIIISRLAELVQIYNTAAKYQQLHSSLSELAQEVLVQEYARFLAPSIQSVDDLLALQEKGDAGLLNQVLLLLEDKYPLLFGTHENICRILPLLSKFCMKMQNVFEHLILPNLYDWITPDNYASFERMLPPLMLNSVPMTLTERIIRHCTSFEIWKHQCAVWKAHHNVQYWLIRNYLEREIRDESVMSLLLEIASPETLPSLTANFACRITTKEALLKYLKLFPENLQGYLLRARVENFITSINCLQEIATCITASEHRKGLFSRFTPDSLRCSEEAFATLCPPDAAHNESVAEEVLVQVVTEMLCALLHELRVHQKCMFDNTPIYLRMAGLFSTAKMKEVTRQIHLIDDLISNLQNSTLSSHEKISFLCDKKMCPEIKIPPEKSRFHFLMSRLQDNALNPLEKISVLCFEKMRLEDRRFEEVLGDSASGNDKLHDILRKTLKPFDEYAITLVPEYILNRGLERLIQFRSRVASRRGYGGPTIWSIISAERISADREAMVSNLISVLSSHSLSPSEKVAALDKAREGIQRLIGSGPLLIIIEETLKALSPYQHLLRQDRPSQASSSVSCSSS